MGNVVNSTLEWLNYITVFHDVCNLASLFHSFRKLDRSNPNSESQSNLHLPNACAMSSTSALPSHATCKFYLSAFALSFLAFFSVVEAFQMVPNAWGIKRSHKTLNLRMRPLDKQNLGDGSGEKGRRIAEFTNLEPVAESARRKARLELDMKTKERFALFGDELWNLRKSMERLSDELAVALDRGSKGSEELIRSELRQLQARDPELAYEMELLEMELARRDRDAEQSEKSERRASMARTCLPQFSLSGLWVGKYVVDSHGRSRSSFELFV